MRRSVCLFATVLSVRSQQNSGSMKLLSSFRDWRFRDPPVYSELPINTNPEYNLPVAVKDAVFSKVPTEPLVGKLHLVCQSNDCLINVLDLEPAAADCEEFVNFVAGSYLPVGGLGVSHRYGGHQFGFWADQLGDGRAHILGEYVNSKNESWQPQLKGSGETPYSRFGDGRAVLRSSIREMVGSEACYFLGIPTTRAAALVVSEDHKVLRDKSYCGHARPEPAAVVMRLAPAWYRLGSFEILHKRNEPNTMRTLADHVIKHYFPKIDANDEDKYVKFYQEVALRNLDMVATWQGSGFTHGVLNTDNVSILGLTIDYGPFGFMDRYNRHHVPNGSDDLGRYAHDKQPSIMLWNLEKFAEALEPIVTAEQRQQIAEFRNTLQEYSNKKILETFIRKLGLEEIKDGDQALVEDLLEMMQLTMADFTSTFRQLGEVVPQAVTDTVSIQKHWSLLKLSEAKQWLAWLGRYRERLRQECVDEETRRVRMRRVNPMYIPRNWMMQEAIADAEKGDYAKVRFLLKIFENPYEIDENAETQGFSSEPPTWSYGLKLNCSS